MKSHVECFQREWSTYPTGDHARAGIHPPLRQIPVTCEVSCADAAETFFSRFSAPSRHPLKQAHHLGNWLRKGQADSHPIQNIQDCACSVTRPGEASRKVEVLLLSIVFNRFTSDASSSCSSHTGSRSPGSGSSLKVAGRLSSLMSARVLCVARIASFWTEPARAVSSLSVCQRRSR